jgi:DNA-binding transcriptional regulator YdaS (Cro superfamily)
MKLTEWLDADRGRLTAMAAAFGLTSGAISQWRENGVPVARMKAVRELTGGAVSLDDMVPDAPHPAERQHPVEA